MTNPSKLNFFANNGWFTTGIEISNGQHLTIVPNRRLKKFLRGTQVTRSVPANLANGLDTGIDVQAGQKLSVTVRGNQTWSGNTGGSTATATANGKYHYSANDWKLDGTYDHAWGLIGKIGSSPWFFVGANYKAIASATGRLYLAMNDEGPDNWYDDNGGSLKVQIQVMPVVSARIGNATPFDLIWNSTTEATDDGELSLKIGSESGKLSGATVILDAPVKSSQDGNCDGGVIAPKALTANPVDLQTGNKLLSNTDMTVQTPAGELAFTRHYNQAHLDWNDAYLGLGWSHNHLYQMTFTGTTPNRTCQIRLPDGGILNFSETSVANDFSTPAGSFAKLTYDSGSNEYVVTLTSDAQIFFDDNAPYLLKRRTWPNTETWTYTYSSGKLQEVEDDYGRKLQFVYRSNPSQFDDGMLWRVGDHSTTNLSSTPTGRYIELGYVTEKINGNDTYTDQRPLLATVKDVRGYVWSYDWYGQDVGENDTTKANLLTRVLSPAVDTDGNGSVNDPLLLQELTYQFSGSALIQLKQRRGVQSWQSALHETTFDFSEQGITTEIISDAEIAHIFANGTYFGAMGDTANVGQQVIDETYRSSVQYDGNDNATQLDWNVPGKPNGKLLQSVTDALQHETTFSYDSFDILTESVDAEGRETEYTYGDTSHPRLPTQIRVMDVDDTLLRWQVYTYDTKGRLLTETLLDPQYEPQEIVLQRTTRTYGTTGNGNGLLESVTIEDLLHSEDVVTTYVYDSAGRVVRTQKSSLFGSCEVSYTVYDVAGNVVASICNYENSGAAPTTASEATALYNSAFPDKNRVTTYGYDTLGRRIETTVNAGSAFAQTTITVYDALNRITRTISNYVPNVAISAPYTAAHSAFTHGSENNQNLVSDTYYYPRGTVRKQVDVLGNTTLFGYDNAGRLIKTIQNASQPSYTDEILGVPPDFALEYYIPNSDTDQDIIITQDYDANGNLVKSIDVLGAVTYSVYDELNRVVKTVRSAKDTADVETDPIESGYVAANDPRSSDYVPSTDPDRDQIETTEYDALGRVVRTQRLMENRGATVWDTSLYGYDPLGRQVRVIRSASNPDYDFESDPDLSNYFIVGEADQDIVTDTFYDVQGRVLETIDTNGNRTRVVYDGLNRQTRTIANYVPQGTSDPADWEWDGSLTRWEDGDNEPIDFGTNNDQNVISETIYDSDGRVEATRDVLRRETRQVYDSVGRVVRTVTNYIEQGASSPVNWHYDSGWQYSQTNTTPINHGSSNDENIISSTVYDSQGRVLETIDHRNNVTHQVYDIVGRRVMSIVNYVAQGSSEPEDWIWSTTNNRWEDGSNNAISFGSNKDQNRITTTTYDIAGRVTRMRDTAGIETRYEYDDAGRRIKVVSNYVNGVFDANAPDEDLISTTVYNKAGQVVSTADVRGTQTAFTYDDAGRRLTVTQAAGSALASTHYTCFDKVGRSLRTIANYVAAVGDAAPDARDGDGVWLFNPTSHGQLEDANLISVYQYDRLGRAFLVTDTVGNQSLTCFSKDGQVQWMTDPEQMQTQYLYDKLRRRTRVVQGYQAVPEELKLAFSSSRYVNDDIFVMDADGTDVENLTLDTDHYNSFPVWSPDGSQIAYLQGTEFGLTLSLYIMSADGSNRTFVTEMGSNLINGMSWSPSGHQLVVSIREEGNGKLYLINKDGSNRRLLASKPAKDLLYPSWSPDGNRILFLIGAEPNAYPWDTAFVQTDGTNYTLVTNNALYNPTSGYDGIARWSRNGQQLAFMTRIQPTGNRQIVTMNTDGTGRKRLSNAANSDFIPTWSPDGTKLAFYSLRDGNREIYVMNADGTNPVRLTNQAELDRYPDWSPLVVDPANWLWNADNSRWEDGYGNPIPHGAENDRNVIVTVYYDIIGRVVSQRDPRGYFNVYNIYDKLNRRILQNNPLEKVWLTAFEDLTTGGIRSTMTMPGITGAADYEVQRDFDRLGRPLSINYGSPTTTPDVTFAYDNAGNRTKMSEFSGAGFTSRIRETTFGYDHVRRLTSVGFDNDGSGSVDETVSYEYDAGGLRTKLVMPGSLDIVYNYNVRGQLIGLTDWDDQQSSLSYDRVGRHVLTERHNGLRSRYEYDAGGRLRRLRHGTTSRTLAEFAYEVDKRGNRTRALEALAHPATTNDTTIAYNDKGLVTSGAWAAVSNFKQTTGFSATLKMLFMGENRRNTLGVLGDALRLTIGIGPDHSIFDLYLDGSLWQTIDGYSPIALDRTIDLEVVGDGLHTLELRNRAERNLLSTGYRLRFKQLVVKDKEYTLHMISYRYDALSRLREARYASGLNAAASDADLLRRYQYAFDLAGNRTQQSIALNGGSPAVTNYSYNGANQLTSDGTNTLTYDNNGNLTNDGTNAYTWDRANRLLSMGGASYDYDGMGNRVKQTIGANVTQYMLDLQPGLAVVLAATQGANTTHYIHAARGIHAQQDAGGWDWMLQDGLGSVRGVADDAIEILEATSYSPYGTPDASLTTTPFAFTGEMRNLTEQQYHRARYYNLTLGVFLSPDPFEGTVRRPMSLNGYNWVEGNIVNFVDPTGMECINFDQEVAGSFRRWACENLSNILYREVRYPSWEEVNECYACAMQGENGYEVESVEAYRQGLLQAYHDQMRGASSDRIERAIYSYGLNYLEPLPPSELPASLAQAIGVGDGYAEGISFSGSISSGYWGGGVQFGIETAFNFATFQRMSFRFGGFATSFSGFNDVKNAFDNQRLGGGVQLSQYVSYISGLQWQFPFTNDGFSLPSYDTFVGQYGGESSVIGVDGSRGLGGSITHFSSPGGSVSGVSMGVSGGISSGLSLGGSRPFYEAQSWNSRTYINPRTCLVDVGAMEADIRFGGNVSPINSFSPTADFSMSLFREGAIVALNVKAIDHNYRVTNKLMPGCGC